MLLPSSVPARIGLSVMLAMRVVMAWRQRLTGVRRKN